MARLLRAPAVAAVVLGLGLAACSGDDGGAGGTTTTATVDPSVAPFCDAFEALLGGPLADDTTDASDPAVLQGAVELTREIVEALRDSAPADVADAAAAVADGYERAFDVLERYGYDLQRVDDEGTPADQAVLDNLGNPPAGPNAVDPFDVLEGAVADRCAPGLTIPADFTSTTG